MCGMERLSNEAPPVQPIALLHPKEVPLCLSGTVSKICWRFYTGTLRRRLTRSHSIVGACPDPTRKCSLAYINSEVALIVERSFISRTVTHRRVEPTSSPVTAPWTTCTICMPVMWLFVAVLLAHIYIGTIGKEGAFEGMWNGNVDVNWAKEHHSLWLDEEMREGEVVPDRHAGGSFLSIAVS